MGTFNMEIKLHIGRERTDPENTSYPEKFHHKLLSARQDMIFSNASRAIRK